jgi:hypothetical protein
MGVTLEQLSAASAGPALSKNNPPSFLTVGDSLMWGQGLRPEHRFRELVRTRIARDHGVVTELAMARSGALLQTEKCPKDATLHDGIIKPDVSLEPWYSPENFAREIPNDAMSIQQQLDTAKEIIEKKCEPGASKRVRWILLDGGINDIGVDNILRPLRAEHDGYLMRCWPTWLLNESVHIEELMSITLEKALKNFPEAAIVVNGCFPIFSYYSVASVTKMQSVGLLYGILNLILTSPIGLDLLANVSTAWQASSSHHLKRAIRRVLRTQEHAGRIVLFARSNIEGPHSLFGPSTWLWGYDSIPETVPQNAAEWIQWLCGATPEDEVIKERISQCNAHEPDIQKCIKCRLASIGHPNVLGAIDYANSIIDVMERAGVLQPDSPACLVAARQRMANCQSEVDEGNYSCYRLDARSCTTCSNITNKIAATAKDLIEDGADRLRNAGKNFKDAAACFDNTPRRMERAAAQHFTAASEDYADAGEHFEKIVDCWNDTQEMLQKCNDEKASKIAECNRDYENRVNASCDIECNSFTNCNRYKWYDPRRYACRAARAACVAAAAIARAACIAGSFALLEACKVAAEAEAVVCKGAEAAENTGCSVSEGGKGIWDGIKGGSHVIAGTGAALGASGSGFKCAIKNATKGLWNAFVGATEVAVGGWVGLVAAIFYGSCTFTRWVVNRSCRIVHWTIGVVCQLGNALLAAPCAIRNSLSRTGTR